MNMFNNRTSIVGGIIVLLLVANIINYFWSNWGLITIHAKDEPIGKVIKSIEWQGWVTIYSNIDPTEKITMDCDRVPLPEAMEDLSVNVEGTGGSNAPVASGTTPGTTGGTPGAGGGGRGFRGGGGGGGAQWHLAFFVAPTSADVKAEIRSFTQGADDTDDSHVFSYATPLTMLGDEDAVPVADPRKQVWPGLKMPPAPPAPPADPAAAANGAPPAAAPAPEAPPTSVQGYLQAFARQADIWIMAPANWDPPVQNPPPPNGSIIAAIRHFVGSAHGSVREAIILRGRPPRVAGDRPRGNRGGGGFDMSMMEDRVDNAINGLPPEVQPAAREKLAAEKEFQKETAALPPEQRRQRMRDHFMQRLMEGNNNWRRSPQKRAQMYAHVVQARTAAIGK